MAGMSGSELHGSISKGRPLVRLFFLTSKNDPLILLDTGCTWEMIMEGNQAQAEQLQETQFVETATLASGQEHTFRIWKARIKWFGAERQIRVHVPVWDENNPQSRLRRAPRDDDPVGIVGTALFDNTHIALDFRAQTVRVSC
jgi:predicted aspartyl protease